LEKLLSDELDALNRAAIASDDETLLSVRVISDDGVIVGGITGWTWGGCGGITSLWLKPELRGRGLGDSCWPLPRTRSDGVAAIGSSSRPCPFKHPASTGGTDTGGSDERQTCRTEPRSTISTSGRTLRLSDIHVTLFGPPRIVDAREGR
jgi:hypothetical protein